MTDSPSFGVEGPRDDLKDTVEGSSYTLWKSVKLPPSEPKVWSKTTVPPHTPVLNKNTSQIVNDRLSQDGTTKRYKDRTNLSRLKTTP